MPFEIQPNEKYILIRLSGRLNQDSDEFEQKIPNFLDGSTKPVLIDCANLQELSSQWLRILAMFSQTLKTGMQAIRLVDVNPEITQMIRQNGLNQILPIKPTVRAVLLEFGLVAAQKIDVNFINPFLVATMRVLEIQANVQAKPGTPFKRGPKDRFSGDISGVIGLVSDSFNGAVVLSFPEKTFLSIMSNMIGEPCTELTQDIADGAGELTNIIFGQAKVALNDRGMAIQQAIPTVVTGKDHNVQHPTTGPRVALPFESNAGPFTVEICLSE